MLRQSAPPSQLFDNPPLPNEASLGGALIGVSSCSTTTAVLSESGRVFIWGQNMHTSGILDGDQPFPGDQAAGCSLCFFVLAPIDHLLQPRRLLVCTRLCMRCFHFLCQ
jgi:hypothetical protein